MIVVDASAVLELLLNRPAAPRCAGDCSTAENSSTRRISSTSRCSR